MLTAGIRNQWNPRGTDASEAWFHAWRIRSLARLDPAEVYADYTGAALYSEQLVRADTERLLDGVLGNPHSESGPSRAATRDLDAARAAILRFVHADPDEYTVVLTANASAACRLVGEAFPFDPHTPFVLSADNHNSVNGIREFARRAGATITVIPIDDDLRPLDPLPFLPASTSAGLFAFPAQSNFSGVRHPMSFVQALQERGYRVLLDAAAYLPTATLDLSRVQPDFVSLSLYKIAGYPTGLGALVARHDALATLRRPWFAGGTVDWVTVDSSRHQMRAGPEQFEDGTPPFLAAGAVPAALAGVEEAKRRGLGQHLSVLTSVLLDGLRAMSCRDGTPAVVLHGPDNVQDRGATVALTLRRADGDAMPFWEVEQQARSAGIALRGGCFCNPGCAETAFGLRSAEQCLDALGPDFTIPRLSACLGDATVGAVRLSLGLGSVRTDVVRVLEFLGGCVR